MFPKHKVPCSNHGWFYNAGSPFAFFFAPESRLTASECACHLSAAYLIDLITPLALSIQRGFQASVGSSSPSCTLIKRCNLTHFTAMPLRPLQPATDNRHSALAMLLQQALSSEEHPSGRKELMSSTCSDSNKENR